MNPCKRSLVGTQTNNSTNPFIQCGNISIAIFFSNNFRDINAKVMGDLLTFIERMMVQIETDDLIIGELQNYKNFRRRLFSCPPTL